jgi:hypothetical protein
MKTFLLVLLLAYALPAGEEAVGTTAVFGWDAVTQDVTGGPETVAQYEIAAFPIGTDLVANPATTPTAKTTVGSTSIQAAASAFLSTQPSGTRLRVSVRAYDTAGNVSDWATPIDIKIDNGKPKAPTNFKKLWPTMALGLGAAVAAALTFMLAKRKK